MKYLKRTAEILVLVLVLVVSVNMIRPSYAGATTNGKTQSDAVNWACARGNEGWNQDVDGVYGCQCVDLILAYYDYLLGYHQSGNAKDYSNNTPPAGWTKVYSNPQPGDVVVWGAGAQMGWYPLQTSYANSSFGHIGIVWRVNASGTISTIETNASQGQKAAYYERYPNNAACFIRPDFASGSSTPTPVPGDGITWSTQTPVVTETNAIVKTHVVPPNRVYVQWSGCNFFDANGTEIAKAGETAGFNASYIDMTWNVNEETWTHYSLQPGTTYKYQFYVTWGGVDHFSPMYSFTTPQTVTVPPVHNHNYSQSVTKAATCSSKGIMTYTCACGSKYTKEIARKAHSNTVIKNKKTATCKAEGYTGDSCCSVCGTVVKKGTAIAKKAHTWDAGKVKVKATATKDGIKEYKCKVCADVRQEKIKATGVKQKPAKAGAILKVSSAEYKVCADRKSVEYRKCKKGAKSVTIPSTIKVKGITYKVIGISENAFKNNKAVTRVTIGANVKYIKKYAFYKCKNLKKIVVKTKLLKKGKIGTKAFNGINARATIAVPKSKFFYYALSVFSSSVGSKTEFDII